LFPGFLDIGGFQGLFGFSDIGAEHRWIWKPYQLINNTKIAGEAYLHKSKTARYKTAPTTEGIVKLRSHNSQLSTPLPLTRA
jgi:hypothetical protein